MTLNSDAIALLRSGNIDTNAANGDNEATICLLDSGHGVPISVYFALSCLNWLESYSPGPASAC